MKLVSIIVPVYNTEKYLEECLDSLVNQSYKNIEVILVDDGSTDRSSYICDEYSKKYDFVKVYHITNGGVSNARNFGIEKSTGEYLVFVDSDDTIESKMIETMIKCYQNNVELVACNYTKMYKDRKECVSFKNTGIVSSKKCKKLIFEDFSIKGYSVNKMYIRKVLIDNSIFFNSNLKICEDLVFNYKYLNYIDKVMIIDHYFYNYRMRKSSATNYNVEKDLTIFKAFDEMYNIDNSIYEDSYEFYLYIYFKYLKSLRKNKIDVRKKIKIYKMILSKRISFKRKMIALYYIFVPLSIQKIIKKRIKKSLNFYE